MMHFALCFFFPYFRKISQTPWKIFPILPFSQRNFRFSSAKISDEVLNFPLFCLFQYIPPYLGKIPPGFRKTTFFLHTLCVFHFPPSLTTMHLCITQHMYWMPLFIQYN